MGRGAQGHRAAQISLREVLNRRRAEGERARDERRAADLARLRKLQQMQEDLDSQVTVTVGELEKQGYAVLVVADFEGERGNSMVLIGTLADSMRRAGRSKDEVNQFLKDAMSGDFDHLIDVLDQHADVVATTRGRVAASLRELVDEHRDRQLVENPKLLENEIERLKRRIDGDNPAWLH
jgi:hypothetical protein